jgi:hypothetical protein
VSSSRPTRRPRKRCACRRSCDELPPPRPWHYPASPCSGGGSDAALPPACSWC